MIEKKLLELYSLNVILSDQLISKRLQKEDPETLKRMLDRYSYLVDKFIHEYKLPETLTTNPVKDINTE